MDHATKSTDLEALEQRLSELDITVCQGKDSRLCAYTTCEPLFCFEADSEEELAKIVGDTLKSYIFTFYQVDSVNVSVRQEPLRTPSVPILALKPISKLLADFSNEGHRHRAFAV